MIGYPAEVEQQMKLFYDTLSGKKRKDAMPLWKPPN